MPEPILSIKDLTVEFDTEDGVVHAVTGVSYDVGKGEVVGVVGESGSGKSVSVMSVLGLIPSARIDKGGQALYKGRDLLKLTQREMRDLRGGELAMIFQDPMTSLNPVLTVGDQIEEALKVHNPDMDDDRAKARTIELLEVVGVPFAEKRVDQYPHEFSGGMRQRGMIAMAIANDPEVLIADEPTTALDVTIQAQIVEVMKAAQRGDPCVDHPDHARSGPDRRARGQRRRHVRRPRRRARRRLHDLQLAAPSVHDRPPQQPGSARGRPGVARADPGPAAEPDHAPPGVRVPSALLALAGPGASAGRTCRRCGPSARAATTGRACHFAEELAAAQVVAGAAAEGS